jgi:hypothetical protein
VRNATTPHVLDGDQDVAVPAWQDEAVMRYGQCVVAGAGLSPLLWSQVA